MRVFSTQGGAYTETLKLLALLFPVGERGVGAVGIQMTGALGLQSLN